MYFSGDIKFKFVTCLQKKSYSRIPSLILKTRMRTIDYNVERHSYLPPTQQWKRRCNM